MINVELKFDNIPPEAMEEVERFYIQYKEMYDKSIYNAMMEEMLKHDVDVFVRQLQQKYIKNNIKCEIRGLPLNSENWSIEDICSEYKKHYSERYVEKDKYTRMEVNNMLFDLEICGVLESYSSVAVPWESSYNNEIFDDTVKIVRGNIYG